MARTPNLDKDLINRLRASGLRKKVAQNVAAALDGARAGTQPSKEITRVIAALRSLANELPDRATGGPSKRSEAADKSSEAAKKRSEAAKKAAATRKRNAAARSAAAQQGARTRAKKS